MDFINNILAYFIAIVKGYCYNYYIIKEVIMEKASFSVVHEYSCDVLVAGGGVGGIAAAVSSARLGQNTMLIESGGFLGGTATKGLVGPFMTCYDSKGKEVIIRGFFAEFVDAMIRDGGAVSYRDCPGGDSHSGYRTAGHIGVTPFDVESFKRVAESLCVDSGLKPLYHAQLIGCETNGRQITSAYIATVRGIERINAKMFIDATGSASLAKMAGAGTFRPDEVQTASTFFRIEGVDKELLDEHMRIHIEMRERYYMDEIVESRLRGEFPCGTRKLRIFEEPNGFWSVNMSQEDGEVNELDPEAVTAAEISQRKQIKEIIGFMRKTVPALKNVKLVDSASDIGIRESRRMVGQHLFCLEDIRSHTKFPDRIAVCANSIDIHKRDHVDYTPHDGENYYVPLACLLSKDIDNLLAAGKCVSTDRYAHAAIRVMPPCMAVGEAAGICASLAAKGGVSHFEVPPEKVQEIIVKNGGYIG